MPAKTFVAAVVASLLFAATSAGCTKADRADVSRVARGAAQTVRGAVAGAAAALDRRPRRSPSELVHPPVLADPGAPPSDVLAAFLQAVPSGDTTVAWALLAPAERARWKTRERFRQYQLGALTECVGLCDRPDADFDIRLEARADRYAVVAGAGDRAIDSRRVRSVPFAFVLTRTGRTQSSEDRWRVGAGATPSIRRVDPPQGAGTLYGTANVRFVIRPLAGRQVTLVRAWLDDEPLAVKLSRVGELTVANGTKQGMRRGIHRVVVLAADSKRRAQVATWRFLVPRMPESLPALGPGDKGPSVVELQERLDALGFDLVRDGYYGEDTEHAVTAFAKINGLATDGVAYASTRRALARPKPVRPRATHSGEWVEIDLSRQVLILFAAGKAERIYDISSGSRGRRTSKGSFAFYNHISGWRHSALGYLWEPYYFHGGMAVHGAYHVPPYPASHGCVRVTLSSMARLKERLRLGMPVEVYGDEP